MEEAIRDCNMQNPNIRSGGSDKDGDGGAGAMTALSHALSRKFSPVLTPTYGLLAVFAFTPLRYASSQALWTVSLIVFGLTGLLPGLAVFLMTKYGDVSDIELSRRRDRLFPYLIMGVALAAAGVYIQAVGMPLWCARFYWGAAVACGVNLLINFRWKISAHGAGMGGLTALFVLLTRYSLTMAHFWISVPIMLTLTGMLCMGRVWLGRHTPLQTVAGSLAGFLSVFLFATINL